MGKSERLVQRSFTGVIRPQVKIITKTENPIGVLYTVWSGTRYPEIDTPEDIQYLYDNGENALPYYSDIAKRVCLQYPEYAGEDGKDYKNVIKSIAQKVLESNVPAGESVHFTIQIDDANVAWREQLVRGRLSQQFWTMSTRIMDMTTMDVNMNESIRLLGGQDAVDVYEDAVDYIRKAYQVLIDMGIPMEDIRLQPQGHTHRVYWMIPLRTLITILNKRCDWIAQSSLWTPIVAGAVSELRRIGLYDIVEPFIGKPMVEVSEGRVTHYMMNADNEDRFSGRDKIPCDPLWLAYKGYNMPEHTDIKFYDYMKSLYIQLWQDKYLEVLGWDRENPEALGPFDRPINYVCD